MNNQLDFMVYCIENYKNAYNLKGNDVIKLFNRYRVLDYIKSSYDALHTTGSQYIINDIQHFIVSRKDANAPQ